MINHSGQWPKNILRDASMNAGYQLAGQTIGANFENALAAIDQPGTEFYVPYPTDEMSCDSVAANMQLLYTFINVWNDRLREAERQLIKSRATIDNCKKIILILSTKLGQYQVKDQVCKNPVVIEPPVYVEEPAPGENTNGEGGENSSGSNSLLWPLALGAAAILFIRSRRNKNVRRVKK
jgi:hypothetical protein